MKKDKLLHNKWEEALIKKIRKAPTIRKGIDELGNGLAKVLESLSIELKYPKGKRGYCLLIKTQLEGYESERFISKLYGLDIDLTQNIRSCNLWAALDEVMYLYSRQLLMSDDEVKKRVYDPKVMNAFAESNRQCFRSAFIDILEKAQDIVPYNAIQSHEEPTSRDT